MSTDYNISDVLTGLFSDNDFFAANPIITGFNPSLPVTDLDSKVSIKGVGFLKTMTASEVKTKFGEFIKSAREEEVIIVKNGVPLLRVTPIRKYQAAPCNS